MIALPAGYKLIEKLKTLMHPTALAKQEIYIVYGKQPSPYPDLSFIDPIIAVMTSEQDCYALENCTLASSSAGKPERCRTMKNRL
ncbi:hypothetical protein [Glutamicibacter sp. FBE19]|uniref:hypothetical protein n=1 Tax=Glutamicibacter sp. FBE19 TaxID=2761534 RepID=UPI00189662F4|nr:hypothetical protein [Glutamicibacter sp. FBE19]MBF6672593.1 hypothetical protein [Glutamicibacter sp. FBE19]